MSEAGPARRQILQTRRPTFLPKNPPLPQHRSARSLKVSWRSPQLEGWPEEEPAQDRSPKLADRPEVEPPPDCPWSCSHSKCGFSRSSHFSLRAGPSCQALPVAGGWGSGRLHLFAGHGSTSAQASWWLPGRMVLRLVFGGRARLRWWRVVGGRRAASLSVWKAVRGLKGEEGARGGGTAGAGRKTTHRLDEGKASPRDAPMEVVPCPWTTLAVTRLQVGATGAEGMGFLRKAQRVSSLPRSRNAEWCRSLRASCRSRTGS